MRKVSALAITGLLAFGLVGCASAPREQAQGGEDGTGAVTIKVGASPTPHAEILAAVQEELAEEGICLEIVAFNDYVQPNLELDSGDLDANYFQHRPYLDAFNQQYGTDIAAIASVHFEPMGLYPGMVTDLSDIPDGAKVGIPDDDTNSGRALLLLEANGLIRLAPGAGISATKQDITENPKNLQILDMQAAQLPKSLDDLGFAVINTNYALQSGLSLADALAMETADSLAAETYANILAVKAGDEGRPELVKLAEALEGATAAAFIRDAYDGEIIPVHGTPE